MDYSQYNLEKTGYMKEDFRLIHINDQTKKDFSYHYHDFHKIIVFISGKVTYHIEGKAYHLKPRDILLVSQGAIHKPEIDPSVPYERYIFWIRDDLSCQELNTCFQKANDRSFNLVRADSALQERLKDLLPEIEQTLQNKHFGDTVLRNALFTQFMIYINRIFLKRRVKRIGIFVKPKIALNVSIIIFMISISCIPVFAYNPPTADLRSVPWTGFFDPAEGAQVSVFDNGNEIECITFEDESSMIPSDEIYFKDTENYFITDNGDIIIIEPGDIQTYAGCSHIFVNGKHKNHSRNKNGGCTVKTYKGKICTKCNYTKDFSLDSTVTYSPCPH